ncbi:MAG: Hsp20/alpha crystallin family protein [Bacteroidales bacterium]
MLPILRKHSYLPNFTDEFFGKDLLSTLIENQGGFSMPAVNILETKDSFKIEVAAPGLKKEDFNIDLHKNLLTISSEKEENKEENDDKIMRREFSYSSFKRTFSLPDLVDHDKVSASYLNGVLSIEIPKREEAKEKPARQISIS